MTAALVHPFEEWPGPEGGYETRRGGYETRRGGYEIPSSRAVRQIQAELAPDPSDCEHKPVLMRFSRNLAKEWICERCTAALTVRVVDEEPS